MAKRKSDQNTVLEQGDIFFFYRPKVGVDVARKLEDVGSFHLILHPLMSDVYRYAAVSLKGLLDPELGASGWRAKMEGVDSKPAAVAKRLKDAHPVPAARACGEGVYAIAGHQGHTHLAYALELPEDPGEVQAALGMSARANPILAVLNPLREALDGPESPQVVMPDYPAEALSLFGDRRTIPANPVQLLDYEGVELLFAETEHLDPGALDIELMPEHEDEKSAEVYGLLKLRREQIPIEPLFEGHWV
jgi:hypothetical protein